MNTDKIGDVIAGCILSALFVVALFGLFVAGAVLQGWRPALGLLGW